jgi:hypothetical protein
MRKRGKRFKRRPLIDPVSYVLTGLKPLPTQKQAHRDVLIGLHGALASLQQGKLSEGELQALYYAHQVSEKLIERGIGAEYIHVLNDAAEALKTIRTRPKFIARGPELTAVLAFGELHEAQLNITTVNTMEDVLRELRKLPRR